MEGLLQTQHYLKSSTKGYAGDLNDISVNLLSTKNISSGQTESLPVQSDGVILNLNGLTNGDNTPRIQFYSSYTGTLYFRIKWYKHEWTPWRAL